MGLYAPSSLYIVVMVFGMKPVITPKDITGLEKPDFFGILSIYHWFMGIEILVRNHKF